ncbi:MAG: VanW family protein [Bacteroidota bacterium]
MKNNSSLVSQHNALNDAVFRSKIFLLTMRRVAINALNPTKQFKDKGQMQSFPVIAKSESALWNPDDNAENWILTAGKIQNLRIASQMINGREVPAGQTFSFWQHIGNPNFGKGFVTGREIREGCIVPTIAGGLCQLSNALYDAALKANFNIIERHRHTKVIKGSLAEQNRDATVKWNYMDLRFSSDSDFRIEIVLTADQLIVEFRSKDKNSTANSRADIIHKASTLNDCYSCGNLQCYKHPGEQAIKKETGITTYILDEHWKEYSDYINTNADKKDTFIVPFHNNRFFKPVRYQWPIKTNTGINTVTQPAVIRSLKMRLFSKRNLFSLSLSLDKNIAEAAAKRIPIESTHLVIAQNLLPFLSATGALGGRTYDVLMTRLPMEKLHERLDSAHSKFPESTTLNDFRAPQTLIDIENKTLTGARHIITPHAEIAELFKNKVIHLPWYYPNASQVKPLHTDKILFPASSLGRKGAYEVRQLALSQQLTVVIKGKATEHADFWQGIPIEFAEGLSFDSITAVVYPAYVEHQPRLLLRALAAGMPVIASDACGLAPHPLLTIVPVGNSNELMRAATNLLQHKTREKVLN